METVLGIFIVVVCSISIAIITVMMCIAFGFMIRNEWRKGNEIHISGKDNVK